MSEVNIHGQPVGARVPGWASRPYAEAPTLVGQWVRLEPLAAHHSADLHSALAASPDDDALWTYRPTPRPADPSAMAEIVAAVVAEPTLQTVAILPTDPALPHVTRAQGISSYTRIDTTHGQVEVAGVLFARALQRTRAATEAMHLLMRHAFEDLGYRRYEWKCDSLNEPSRRAATRLGFSYEGRFRNHMVTQGRNRDTDWFSISDDEWPVVRDAHEAWLDPGNFEDTGRQRAALKVPIQRAAG